MLGKRGARHETARQQVVQAAAREYDFAPGQRVMTVDGYPGKVTAVQDGPFRGNEAYDVTLDNGMGGGLYTSGQLRSISEKTSDLHTAADDYPELGSILTERPDIAPNQVMAAKHFQAEDDCPDCGGDGKNHDPKSKRKSCAKCDGWGNLRPTPSHDFRQKTAANAWDSLSGDNRTATPEGTKECDICHLNPVGGAHGGQHGRSDGMSICHSCMQHSPDRNIPERYRPNHKYPSWKPLEHGLAPSMNALHTAAENDDASYHTKRKRLFGCAYCEANNKGMGNYGQHCPMCPNETSHDLEAHGHTADEHKNAQLMADMEEHLNNCPMQSTGMGDLGLGADSNDLGVGSGAGTGDGGGGAGCPVCNSLSNGDPGGYNGDDAGSMSAYALRAEDVFDPKGLEEFTKHQKPSIHDSQTEHYRQQSQRSEDAMSRMREEPSAPGSKPEQAQVPVQDRGITNEMHLGTPENKWTPGAHITPSDPRGMYHPKHPGNKETCPHCNGTADFNAKQHLKEFHRTLEGRPLPNPHAALNPDLFDMLRIAAVDTDFRFHMTASWADVRIKAKGLRESGRVRITAASEGFIAGEVLGENHVYSTVLQRMPGKLAVAAWECGCKWAAYAWGRSEKFRRFEGRMCSHALAMHYEAQSRGMFGREITEDPNRKEWLRASDPIVVRWDKDKKRNDTRRAVPPANMKRTFSALEDDGVSLMAVAMSEFAGQDPDEVVLLLRVAGIGKSAIIELAPELAEIAGAGEGAGAGAAAEAEGGGIGTKFKNMITDHLMQQHKMQQNQQHPQEQDQGINSQYNSPSYGKPGDLTAPFISALTTPGPALPETTGEDEPDPQGAENNLTPELEDDSRTASLISGTWSMSSEASQNAGLDWIMEGTSEDSKEIAGAARAALAKMAYKDFSPGEQMQLINEGADVRAANLDRLDIADTHYASLADEEDWMS